MSSSAVLRIPRALRSSKETLLLVEPWYRREDGGVIGGVGGGVPGATQRDAYASSRPAILTFTEPRFVDAFFSGIESSGPLRAAGAFESLRRWRDWSEPPTPMLDAAGAKLFPDSIVRDVPRADEVDSTSIPDEGEHAWLRKLYLPVHKHFHIVACDLVCERLVGPVRVAGGRVVESGCIVRRLARDPGTVRWLDWVPGDRERGVWTEVADERMVPLAGGGTEALDPRAVSASVVDPRVLAQEPLIGLGLSTTESLSLAPVPMVRVPNAKGDGANHTSLWAYLPTVSDGVEVPLAQPDLASVDAVLAGLTARTQSDLTDVLVDRADEIRAEVEPLAVVFFATALMPEAVRSPDASVGLTTLIQFDVLTTPPSAQARTRLLELAEDAADDLSLRLLQNATSADDTAVDWFELHLEDVSQDVRNDGSVELWIRLALSAHLASFEGLVVEAFVHRAHPLPSSSSLFPAPPPTDSAASARRRDATLAGLRRLRAHRVRLMAQILHVVQPREYPSISGAVTQIDQRVDSSGRRKVTAASLRDELVAWLELDALRATYPQQFPALRSSLPTTNERGVFDRCVSVHDAALPLEGALARIHEVGTVAGWAYPVGVDARVAALHPDRDQLLADYGVDVRAQPDFGLLVHPGPRPTANSLAGFRDTVVAQYPAVGTAATEALVQGVLTSEAKRQSIDLPRFDPDHLYAVWCYAVVAGHDSCGPERVVWSQRTDVFSLAEPLDVLGLPQVPVQMPNIPNLIRNLPRIPKAGAKPFVAMHFPADSSFKAGSEPEDTAREWGIAWICTLMWPAFTLVAWILFSIIFSILIILPGFAWLLLLKICIPVPKRQ